MAPPPVRPIVIDFSNDETEKLMAEEETQESPSEKHEAEPAPFPYTADPRIVSLPERSALITRLRYSLVVLNTIVPLLLDCSGIFPTRGLLTVGAFLFAACSVWQYRRDTARTKEEAAQATKAGDANAIAKLNDRILRQIRYDVIGAWLGAGTWLIACLIWIGVEVLRPEANMARVAAYIIAVSAAEMLSCVALAVLLSRHRREAREELYGRAMEFV